MANWERLAEQSQDYTVGDFQQAGYRLVMEQVLYAADRRSRVAYDLIVKHLATYRELLGKLGIVVVHNPHMSYLVATPNQYVAEKMRLSETRLALVLRRLYDDKIHATEIVAGEAFVELIELERAYKDLLSRELPDKAELRELLRAIKRYGLVKFEEADDDQPFQIVIRPGIVDVLGETALLQLANHAPVVGGEDDDEAA
ncbi:DUF4194 domain-containing protein [Lysobacter sp. Root604]|uniref:DUF4194 domain-containing protein n=1 Tax=Lysobacter sp. Root604 TaxID=1736568 RepID=UPI0006F698E1|nr:DUF4194 domain-containing protein [Lysobacter sp. Root604]KRA17513.1 hypothetical protein ASD69_12575 [Lysobacter sp. Root604]